MVLHARLARLWLLGMALLASAHAGFGGAAATAPAGRSALTVLPVSRWPRELHALPGEWLLLSSRQSLSIPHLFGGQTTLTFRRHGGCCFYLVSPEGEERLVGVRVGSMTGRNELRAALKAGTSPLTIWCVSEKLEELPPLPSGRTLVLSVLGEASPSAVARFRGVSALRLTCGAEVTDLSPLAALTDLKTLWLSAPGVADLGPLKALERLEVLHLDYVQKVTDVSPLGGLRNLRSLSIRRGESLVDIAPLAELSQLSVLELNHCDALADLSPLARLTGLTWLDLGGCRGITDLSPLRDLAHLATLDLSECTGISDLSPLAGLAALGTLGLRDAAKVTDLSPLARLPKLNGLDLQGCRRVANLWPLRKVAAAQPRRVTVDRRLADQLTCVAENSPDKVTVIMNGHHAASVGMPLEHPGELDGWVNIVSRSTSASLVRAAATERLLYPAWKHPKGSVLDFEWRGCLVTLSVDRGTRRLAGVVATTSFGVAMLGGVLAHGASPLVIWTNADSLPTLPPFPPGRDLTLVVLGLGAPIGPLSRVRNLSGLCVECPGTSASSLYLLRRLTGLKSLALVSTPQVTSLYRLSTMTQLTSLALPLSPRVRDLGPLARLGELHTLQLTCNGPADLSPLAALPELMELKLDGNGKLTRLAGLDKLTGLEILSLHRMPASVDLSPLASLTGLRALRLVDCEGFYDLSALACLGDLEVLTLRGCGRIADLAPLAQLPRLRRLDVEGCPSIADPTPLEQLAWQGIALNLDGRLERLLTHPPIALAQTRDPAPPPRPILSPRR